MARETLFGHPKFLRLIEMLGDPAVALGSLEWIWHAANASGNPLLGDAREVEMLARWRGEPGTLTAALVACGGSRAGFLDVLQREGQPPLYRVHDYLHHAPGYAAARSEREEGRRQARPCAFCGREKVRDPRGEYCGKTCRQAAWRARHAAAPRDASATDLATDPRRIRDASSPVKTGVSDGSSTDRATHPATDRGGSVAFDFQKPISESPATHPRRIATDRATDLSFSESNKSLTDQGARRVATDSDGSRRDSLSGEEGREEGGSGIYTSPAPTSRDVRKRREVDSGPGGQTSLLGEPDDPPAKPSKKRPKRSTGEAAEIRWRVEDAFAAHVRARRKFFEAENGQPGPTPRLTERLAAIIEQAILDHDADLLGPNDRERWKRESLARAAGIGIFLDPWCTGTSKDNDVRRGGKRYIEPDRPWRQQRDKPDPVARFAGLYFDRKAQHEQGKRFTGVAGGPGGSRPGPHGPH